MKTIKKNPKPEPKKATEKGDSFINTKRGFVVQSPSKDDAFAARVLGSWIREEGIQYEDDGQDWQVAHTRKKAEDNEGSLKIDLDELRDLVRFAIARTRSEMKKR